MELRLCVPTKTKSGSISLISSTVVGPAEPVTTFDVTVKLSDGASWVVKDLRHFSADFWDYICFCLRSHTEKRMSILGHTNATFLLTSLSSSAMQPISLSMITGSSETMWSRIRLSLFWNKFFAAHCKEYTEQGEKSDGIRMVRGIEKVRKYQEN